MGSLAERDAEAVTGSNPFGRTHLQQQRISPCGSKSNCATRLRASEWMKSTCSVRSRNFQRGAATCSVGTHVNSQCPSDLLTGCNVDTVTTSLNARDGQYLNQSNLRS
jgi:hypothetical protein